MQNHSIERPMRENTSTDQLEEGLVQDGKEAQCQNCIEGMSKIDSHDLAVLQPGYKRELMSSWRTTKIFTKDGNATTIGEDLKLNGVHFLVFGEAFAELIGPTPHAEIIAEKDHGFAHEGPVYLPESNEVFFTSNRLGGGNSGEPEHVKLYAIEVDSGDLRHIPPENPVPFANGAVAYKDGVALLAQGHQEHCPGGVISLNPYTGEWHWLINNWFGLAFNSPNDIVHTKADGALWFTDPTYAANQGFKGKPQLGEYVWRFVPGGPPARVMADGFERPNGLALSPDQLTMYVSDTGLDGGADDQEMDPRQPHSIYAFDIIQRSGGCFLANRRMFATNDTGIPDGVKLDRNGNVYSGCGDGLNVWAASGDLIGKIYVEGGVSNFCFAGNVLILLAETRILKINLLCDGKCAAH